MPIHGRTPKECFDTFVAHLRKLVSGTLTSSYQLHTVASANDPRVVTLGFYQGDEQVTVPLRTSRHGTLHLGLAQILRAEPEGRTTFRLTTESYWYRLQRVAAATDHALIRWEYDRREKHHCRHHVQQRASIQTDRDVLDLNKLHLPTGWVTVEEVIRFVIDDLGVKPPCGKSWTTKLVESERRFFEEFTGKRYRTPTL